MLRFVCIVISLSLNVVTKVVVIVFLVRGSGIGNQSSVYKHVGDHNSIHTQCLRACEDPMNASQHIEVSLPKQSDQVRVDYRTRLTAS